MQQRFARPGGPPARLRPTTLPRVVRSFRPYIGEVVLIVAAVFIAAGLGVLPFWFLRIIVDRGLIAHNWHDVKWYSIWTVVVTIGSVAASLGYGYLSVVVGQQIMRDLRDQLFDHLQGMSLRFFTQTRTGEIQSRLANDVSGVQSAVSDAAAQILSNLTTVVSVVIAMFTIDWRLTLMSIAIIPFFAVGGKRIGDYGRKIRTGSQAQLATLNSLMQETLSVSGALLTKTSGRREMVHQRFVQENNRLAGWQVRAQMIQRYFFTLLQLVFSIMPALVYYFAAYFIYHGDNHLTVGAIVAFVSLQGRFFFPLTNLLNFQVEILSALAMFDRIYEYLDMPQDIQEVPDAIAVPPEQVEGRVTFSHVVFRYDPESDRPTLQDINFEAQPGQLVALVGPSGAGKTTLTYLIPRLYDPDSGSVSVDGRDIRKLKLESLAAMVGVVTQETYLVHDTIRENLRYGRPDATDEQLMAAARAAAIHDHIQSLPEGYDTVVGERGYKLSGGEKQRVAIARAILKNPRILILDEATSALDTRSERMIQSALEPLMKGRTTFAIAHRLSTVLAADQILVLEAGRIVERGTYQELLAQGGLFARLYHEQFGRGTADDSSSGNHVLPDAPPVHGTGAWPGSSGAAVEASARNLD